MIKAIIFDMDGVIIDSEIQYVKNVQTLLKGHGVEIPIEDLYYLGGGPNKYYNENIAKLLNVPLEVATAYYKQFNIDHPTDFKSLLRPEAIELLDYLKAKGYPLALASSGTMERIKMKFDQCQLDGYFDVVVSGTQFTKTKPDPEIFLHTAKLLEIDPQECMVIEDSNMGITAGHSANMCVVALYDPRFKFDTSLATHVITSLDQVKDILVKD